MALFNHPSVDIPAVPRGCYASTEWTATFNDDGGETSITCVEYRHPTYGVYGVMEYRSVNGELVSAEFVKYDESL